jgi:hypothetical protein
MLAPHISEDIGGQLNNIRLALVSRLPIVNLSVYNHNIHFLKIKNVFLTLIFFELGCMRGGTPLKRFYRHKSQTEEEHAKHDVMRG